MVWRIYLLYFYFWRCEGLGLREVFFFFFFFFLFFSEVRGKLSVEYVWRERLGGGGGGEVCM